MIGLERLAEIVKAADAELLAIHEDGTNNRAHDVLVANGLSRDAVETFVKSAVLAGHDATLAGSDPTSVIEGTVTAALHLGIKIGELNAREGK